MNKFFCLALLLFLTSCYRVSNKLEPNICYSISEKNLKEMPSPFSPLSSEERKEDWGKEYTIALAYAKKLDLYPALQTFKRAEILLPKEEECRRQEIEYYIVLCYFLGKKCEETVNFFEESSLPCVDKSFTPFHDLLLILYECYNNLQDEEKAERIKNVLDESFPDTKEQLQLTEILTDANIDALRCLKEPRFEYISNFLKIYDAKKKSVKGAQLLNTFLPGSGYLYLGQKKSALTAFLLNGLFIYAAYEFFHRGNIAAGIITTSFEAGWYFGGIYGAGEEAKFYNERIYNEEASKILNSKKLTPFFLLRYSF
jgi:hypothetical protein